MSTKLVCEECEFYEYIDYLIFPSNPKKNWIKEFCDIEQRFIFFCCKECKKEYKGYKEYKKNNNDDFD